MHRKASAALVSLLVAATALVAVVGAPAARATAPGYNGKIAFGSNRSGSYQIWSVNPDDSALTQLTHDAGGANGPAWSPDGAKIAFANFGSAPGLYVMNKDGSNEHMLVAGGVVAFIAWSGDGSKLAYVVAGAGSDDDI